MHRLIGGVPPAATSVRVTPCSHCPARCHTGKGRSSLHNSTYNTRHILILPTHSQKGLSHGSSRHLSRPPRQDAHSPHETLGRPCPGGDSMLLRRRTTTKARRSVCESGPLCESGSAVVARMTIVTVILWHHSIIPRRCV